MSWPVFGINHREESDGIWVLAQRLVLRANFQYHVRWC